MHGFRPSINTARFLISAPPEPAVAIHQAANWLDASGYGRRLFNSLIEYPLPDRNSDSSYRPTPSGDSIEISYPRVSISSRYYFKKLVGCSQIQFFPCGSDGARR